ncbi:MAG: MFS transporter [Deltaproteobacteria bacterium]|nr:MFS transporter [Deltaproteobacteria bacterium]
MDQKNHPPAALAWLVWGLGAAFYFTGFYHRVAPAVMTDSLMADFHIGAAGLGNFTAFYFYSYFLMQVPTGILADYWGPRKLLAAGSLVAAAGSILFASATSIIPANMGRLLIGGAVGVAYVAILRLATRWFEPRFYATLGGLTLFCGVSGAVSAGVPLHFLVTRFGWRPVMFFAAAVLLLIGAAIWLIIRDDPAERGYRSFAVPESEVLFSLTGLKSDLVMVFGYRNTWLLSLVGCGLTGSVLTFAGLWGVPFLTTHYGIPVAASSAITSTLLICFAVGAIMLASLSDRIGLRKPILFIGSVLALFCWIPILFFPGLSLWLLVVMVILVGLACGSVTTGFAFAKESVPSRFAGTVSGVYNMGSMLGVMILQPAIGWILDLSWQGTIAGGVRIYSLAAYRSGFVLIVIISILSVLAISFTVETHCRQEGIGAAKAHR